MNAKRIILGGIACLAMLGGMLTAPAQAAGTVDGIVSDTTGTVRLAMGGQYRFTVTPRQKGAKIGYAAGDGNILDTFVSEKPTHNADGTDTYHFGFKGLTYGDTGVYIENGGKSVCLFTVHVSPDYQTIQKAVDDGHQPWRINPVEVAGECVADNKLQTKTDTWDNPTVTKNRDGTATAVFKKDGKPTLEVDMYQPVRKGPYGIWAVSRWTDLTTGVSHTVE